MTCYLMGVMVHWDSAKALSSDKINAQGFGICNARGWNTREALRSGFKPLGTRGMCERGHT